MDWVTERTTYPALKGTASIFQFTKKTPREGDGPRGSEGGKGCSSSGCVAITQFHFHLVIHRSIYLQTYVRTRLPANKTVRFYSRLFAFLRARHNKKPAPGGNGFPIFSVRCIRCFTDRSPLPLGEGEGEGRSVIGSTILKRLFYSAPATARFSTLPWGEGFFTAPDQPNAVGSAASPKLTVPATP